MNVRKAMHQGEDDRLADAAKEMVAMSMIGDGLIATLMPKRHLLLWKFGPEPYRRLTSAVAGRPMMVRAIAAAELAAGLWWARRLTRQYAS